jgi:hypothetical protein
MTTQNSDFLALVDAVSPGLVSGCGPVKRYPFTFTQVGAGGGAGDIARLVKLPGGARVLAGGIVAANSAAGGAVLGNVGWEAYQRPDGTTAPAATAGFSTGISLVNPTLIARPMIGTAVAAYSKVFEGPAVLVLISTGGAFPAGFTVDGWVDWI